MALPIISYSDLPHPTLHVVLVDPFLDITVHQSVREAIEAQWRDGLASISIDCQALEFMDSSGVGLLVALHRRLGGGGARIVLHNVRLSIRGVLSLLCLEDLFIFQPTTV